MADFPKISRAIPQQRYKYGEFLVSVLGDIESPEPHDYRYIMAFVKEGGSKPVAFVTCERSEGDYRQQGQYQLRVINSSMDEVMAADDSYGKLSVFCEQGLEIGSQLLSLSDEQPFPIG